jgi:hypothetical protein
MPPFEGADASHLERIRARADLFLAQTNEAFFHPRGLTAMVVSEPVRDWLLESVAGSTSSGSASLPSPSPPSSAQVHRFSEQLVASVAEPSGGSGGKGFFSGVDDKISAWGARVRERRAERAERWGSLTEALSPGRPRAAELRGRVHQWRIETAHRRIDARRKIESVFLVIVPV